MKRSFLLTLILCSISIKSYAQLVQDFKVNTDETTYNQSQSKIGADKDGNFVVVWNDGRVLNNPYGYYQLFNQNGSLIRNNMKVYNGNLINGNCNIVVRENGDFFITVIETNIATDYYTLRMKHFDKTGDSLSQAKIINEDTILVLGKSSLAYSAYGNLVACWELHPFGTNYGRIVFQRFDSLGNKLGNNVIGTDTLSYKENPAITVREDGSFILIWCETNSVFSKDCYCQMFDNQGNRIGGKIRASQTIHPDYQYNFPQIASDSLGRFCTVFSWYNIQNGVTQSVFQLFDKNGNKKGNNVVYSSEFETGSQTVCSESLGEMLLGYDAEYQTVMLKIDTLGNPIGSRFFLTSQYPGIIKGDADHVISNKRIISSWTDKRTGNLDIYSNILSYIKPDSVVAIHNISTEIPKGFKLHQNYPNPFNPTTKINYELPNTNYVSLKVYSSLGMMVAELVNQRQAAGTYSVDLNANEYNLPSGIYFYRLEAGSSRETKKLLLIK